jgi:hypothetical protein
MFGWYGLFLGPLLLVCSLNLFRVALGDLVHGEPVRASALSVGPTEAPRDHTRPSGLTARLTDRDDGEEAD